MVTVVGGKSHEEFTVRPQCCSTKNSPHFRIRPIFSSSLCRHSSGVIEYIISRLFKYSWECYGGRIISSTTSTIFVCVYISRADFAVWPTFLQPAINPSTLDEGLFLCSKHKWGRKKMRVVGSYSGSPPAFESSSVPHCPPKLLDCLCTKPTISMWGL